MSRFDELMLGLEEQSLNFEEREELKALLADPANRAEMVAYLRATTAIESHFREDRQEARILCVPKPGQVSVLARWFGMLQPLLTPQRGAWAAYALILLLVLGTFFQWKLSSEPSVVLSDLHGAVQIGNGKSQFEAQAGSRIASGYFLECGEQAGGFQLNYPDGTTVVATGPCRLQRSLSSEGETLVVELGSLSAHVQKQPHDRHFIFRTPFAAATVLGTRLKLVVKAESTRLAVTEGSVRMDAPKINESAQVDAGTYAVATGQSLEKGLTPQGEILWKADAENPLEQEWASTLDTSHLPLSWANGSSSLKSDRITQDPEVKLQGSKSYRFDLNASDANLNTFWKGEEVELAQGNPTRPDMQDRLFAEGDDRWISWAVRLAPGFPTNVEGWQVVASWTQTESVGSPVLSLNIQNGMWSLNHISWDENEYDFPADGVANSPFAPAVAGRWVKFTLHVRFSADPHLGSVELFGEMADGRGWRTLVPFKETNTLKRNTVGRGGRVPTNLPIKSHARIGIARDPEIKNPARLYIDGYTVGTTREAVEESAFGP